MTDLLSGIVDLFEGGSAVGKGVLEVIGRDVATFCDDLIKASKTKESIDQEVAKSIKKVIDKDH